MSIPCEDNDLSGYIYNIFKQFYTFRNKKDVSEISLMAFYAFFIFAFLQEVKGIEVDFLHN